MKKGSVISARNLMPGVLFNISPRKLSSSYIIAIVDENHVRFLKKSGNL